MNEKLILQKVYDYERGTADFNQRIWNGENITEISNDLFRLTAVGLIDGIRFCDDIDNVDGSVIIWQLSRPRLTMKGLMRLEECAGEENVRQCRNNRPYR